MTKNSKFDQISKTKHCKWNSLGEVSSDGIHIIYYNNILKCIGVYRMVAKHDIYLNFYSEGEIVIISDVGS